MSEDLRLTNATVLDGDGRTQLGATLVVRDGRVSHLGPALDHPLSGEEIDLAGDLLVPGLTDMHTHVFHGVGGSADPDLACLRRGATTAVDAGSAGAATFPAFRRVAESASTRLLSWLNLSTVGLVDTNVGELIAMPWLNVDAAVRTIEENRDLIVGIKARLSSYAVGGPCLPVVRELIRAADAAGVPVMVHIGDTAESLTEILPHLRPGDVVTHMFTGRKNGLLHGDGRILPAAFEARERGVLFDAARGANHAAYPVMEAAVAQGLLPDTLSTDVTAHTAGNPEFDLALLATELMSFGVGMAEMIPMMTSTPAATIGHPELGRLSVGAAAEATVLRVESEPFTIHDVDGRPRTATERVRIVGVLQHGRYLSLLA